MSEQSLEREAIAQEIKENLASLLGWEAGATIEPTKRFEAMGLDSLLAMDLLSALEARYGTLSETLLRDYNSIERLTDYLHKKKTETP